MFSQLKNLPICLILCIMNLNSYANTTGKVQINSCNNLDSMKWILKDWVEKNDETVSNESWTKISSKTFEGKAEVFSIKKNKIVNNESMLLTEMLNQIFFIAKVKHNALPVAFKLINCTDKEFLFENQSHDFPKMLTYSKINDNEMHVKIEGENNNGFLVKYILLSRE